MSTAKQRHRRRRRARRWPESHRRFNQSWIDRTFDTAHNPRRPGDDAYEFRAECFFHCGTMTPMIATLGRFDA